MNTLARRNPLALLAGAIALGALVGVGAAIAQQGGGTRAPIPGSGLPHNPGRAGVVERTIQAPVPTKPTDPTATTTSVGTPVPAGVGRLNQLKSNVSATGWVAVERPGFPISAKMPADFYADFTEAVLLDGSRSWAVAISDDDPAKRIPGGEGAPVPRDSVALRITVYSAGGPPGTARQSPGEEFDRTRLQMLSPAVEASIVHIKNPSFTNGGVMSVVGEFSVGGKLMTLNGFATKPDSDGRVAILLGLVASVAVR
jgi:hypothetical protein